MSRKHVDVAPLGVSAFIHHVWSTSLSSWHILFFFAVWATAICLIDHHVHPLALQSTLLTVLGTVLGFVISFRTTTSYDRYNEARKLWSQLVFATRIFARTVWFHVPENAIGVKVPAGDDGLLDECRAKTLLEKKAVINLLEAYAIAVKHYLREEHGVKYRDINPFVKFLPRYSLPSNISPYVTPHQAPRDADAAENGTLDQPSQRDSMHSQRPADHQNLTHASGTPTEAINMTMRSVERGSGHSNRPRPHTFRGHLLPAENPPDRSFIDQCSRIRHRVFWKEARLSMGRWREQDENVPLEISFYLSSYIAALEDRNDSITPRIEPPTMTVLHTSLSQLVEALTEMERIATTTVIYSTHLWMLTIIYCLILPFQLLSAFDWLTIPATVLVSFMFFGFLIAGAQIENPFGYEKNHLNLQGFIHNIHTELHAMASRPTPRPADWALSSKNNRLFPLCRPKDLKVTPEEWIHKGSQGILDELSSHAERCFMFGESGEPRF